MDLERITELIVHLLDNAGKYSPAGTPFHVTAELRGSEVVTSVADHGPGVDDMEQQMIFEKFYRGRDQRMMIQGTGMGMGLAIAKAIVELHGGKIGVTSQLGRGSPLLLFSVSCLTFHALCFRRFKQNRLTFKALQFWSATSQDSRTICGSKRLLH
jgi:signal transduction histidine kinase